MTECVVEDTAEVGGHLWQQLYAPLCKKSIIKSRE